MIFETKQGQTRDTCLSVAICFTYGGILEIPRKADYFRWNTLLSLTVPVAGVVEPGDVLLWRKPCAMRGQDYDWKTSQGWQGPLRPVHAICVLGGELFGEWSDEGGVVISAGNHSRRFFEGHPMYELRRKA